MGAEGPFVWEHVADQAFCIVPSLRMDGSVYLYSPREHKDTQAQLYLIHAWRGA